MVLVAVDGIVMAAGMVLFMAAVLGVSAVMADGFDEMVVRLSLGVPGFGYGHDGTAESGNALFMVYSQLRWACVPVIAVAAIAPALARRQPAGRAVLRAALAVSLLFAFPPVWDHLAWAAGAGGTWVLNPDYTLDPDRPCPGWWDEDQIRTAHDSSPYGTGGDIYDACRLGFRVSYVVQQAAGITTTAAAAEGGIGEEGVLGFVAGAIPAGLEGVFVNIFAAVLKAVMMIDLVLAAAAAGVVLDLFTGLVIGSLPVMVALGMVPGFGGVSGRFLGAVPGLLLAPVATAVVLVAGSSAVAASAAGAGELSVWVGAVSVLFLAAFLPAAMVPAVSSVVHLSTGAVSSAVSSAAVISAEAARGAAAGAVRGGRARALSGGLEGLARGHVVSWDGGVRS